MQYFIKSVIITIIVVIYFIISHLKWELLAKLCCCCSVTKSCPTLCDLMDYSTPGFPVLHYLPKVAQIQVHWVSDAIYPYYPLSPLSPLLPLFPSLLNMLHQIKEIERKQNRITTKICTVCSCRFFGQRSRSRHRLCLKKKKKNFQILRFSGMSPFDISPSLGETSSGEWIWDSKVMSGWTLIVSRSLFQHWIPGENEEAEKHQSTTEGQNELHLTETPTYWGGALGKFFSKKGKACFWNC